MNFRFAAALLALALLALPTAAAHASRTTDDGKYRVTWGWLEEPAHLGEKLRLDLIIRDNATGAGVGGLTAANITEVTLVYGESTYDFGDVAAYRGPKTGGFAGEGNYTGAVPVLPTREGIYALRIKGDVRGTPVDMTIPAQHELHGTEDIAFPDAAAHDEDVTATIEALEQRIAALEAKAQAQSTTPTKTQDQSNDAPGFGVLAALAAVGVVLMLRRRT